MCRFSKEENKSIGRHVLTGLIKVKCANIASIWKIENG